MMCFSPVVQFPYENIDGVYQYPDKLRQEMEGFLHKELCKYVEEEHIFAGIRYKRKG